MTEKELTGPRQKTKLALFALSGNQCAFPECAAPVFVDGTIVGKIAHIHAQSPGGPRHDPISTDELHAISNLLLLCGPHHDVVDQNPARFDAQALQKMKANHESRDISASNSLLTKLIDVLTPEVPANWWERPGAPRFRPDAAGNRSPTGPWRFEITLEQIAGSDIGGLRYGYRLGDGDFRLQEPRLLQDRKWRLSDVVIPARNEPFELGLQFWWDGAKRTHVYTWEKVQDVGDFDSEKVARNA